ncbi:hypothetical protein [Sphingomonas montana]|uniref:hypothetical protein n=1 Tax=Sphingomonas montana TaxID=1843236 RepID=UPI0019D1D913|nr:hypothetical protein [Sphingomonas montana]
MIVAVLLGLAAPVQVAPAQTPLPPSDDIVVTARRLKQLNRLRIVTRADRRTGTQRCVFKRRSGDPRLDAAVCATVLACAAHVRTEAEIVPCVKPAMDTLVPGIPWQANRSGERH